MPSLAKKWTRKTPYKYLDRKYPRWMVIFWEKGKKVVTTYARWLYENEVGKIPVGKTIHHNNEDKLDDRIENYKLFTHSEHTAHHQKIRINQMTSSRTFKRQKRYCELTNED